MSSPRPSQPHLPRPPAPPGRSVRAAARLRPLHHGRALAPDRNAGKARRVDGIALGETIASVCIPIDERATVARLARGLGVLGCRYDANAALPDETEVIRRAAAWIRAGKP